MLSETIRDGADLHAAELRINGRIRLGQWNGGGSQFGKISSGVSSFELSLNCSWRRPTVEDYTLAPQFHGWAGVLRLPGCYPRGSEGRRRAPAPPNQNSTRAENASTRAGKVLLKTPAARLVWLPLASNVRPVPTPLNSGWLKTL